MPPHTHTPSLVFQPIRRPIQWTASAHLFLKVIPPLEGQVHVSRQLSLICMSYYPKKGPCTRCHLILFICTTYRTVTHSLTWQLYGGLGDSLWQTSRSQKRTTPSYIGAVPCVQHSWHCHKKAHCPVTYGTAVSELTPRMVRPQSSLQWHVSSPTQRQGKCSSQTHLWFRCAPHLGTKCYVNIFWSHVEQVSIHPG